MKLIKTVLMNILSIYTAPSGGGVGLVVTTILENNRQFFFYVDHIQ